MCVAWKIPTLICGRVCVCVWCADSLWTYRIYNDIRRVVVLLLGAVGGWLSYVPFSYMKRTYDKAMASSVMCVHKGVAR